jgi:hypothetical protein
MTRFATHMDPEFEHHLDRQLNNLVNTTIHQAVESYEGIGSYGMLAKHIDRKLQKVGVTLTEIQLRAIAIEALRRKSEQDENN